MCPRELKLVLYDDLEGWNWRGRREIQEGGDICVPLANSC